jgi:RNA polymerase sigma factor (TIGR02999 family)
MAPDQPAADRPSITELLLQVRGGDPEAMNHLFPLVYGELRRLAHWQLQHERTGHTLDTGALVHETYLKIVDQPRVHWRDRAHFFRVASWAMRRILVDYARSHGALRRGGGVPPLSLEDELAVAQPYIYRAIESWSPGLSRVCTSTIPSRKVSPYRLPASQALRYSS